MTTLIKFNNYNLNKFNYEVLSYNFIWPLTRDNVSISYLVHLYFLDKIDSSFSIKNEISKVRIDRFKRGDNIIVQVNYFVVVKDIHGMFIDHYKESLNEIFMNFENQLAITIDTFSSDQIEKFRAKATLNLNNIQIDDSHSYDTIKLFFSNHRYSHSHLPQPEELSKINVHLIKHSMKNEMSLIKTYVGSLDLDNTKIKTKKYLYKNFAYHFEFPVGSSDQKFLIRPLARLSNKKHVIKLFCTPPFIKDGGITLQLIKVLIQKKIITYLRYGLGYVYDIKVISESFKNILIFEIEINEDDLKTLTDKMISLSEIVQKDEIHSQEFDVAKNQLVRSINEVFDDPHLLSDFLLSQQFHDVFMDYTELLTYTDSITLEEIRELINKVEFSPTIIY